MGDLCHNCDKPKATPRDFATIPGGQGDHLCWATYTRYCPSVDWRARCLEAEARAAKLKAALGKEAQP